MAIIKNAFGKVNGKIGNILLYEGRNGENICRSLPGPRGVVGELQKRQAVAFGTISSQKRWLKKVISLGFPGGGSMVRSYADFMRANVSDLVTTEKIDPEKASSPRKKAMKEFRGVIDYRRFRVAAGSLETPTGRVEVDPETRIVRFYREALSLESIDCFSDDSVYGVILSPAKRYCNVIDLGMRGEDSDKQAKLQERLEMNDLYIYLFAITADGKSASDSVCVWPYGD